jgi:Caspase domain
LGVPNVSRAVLGWFVALLILTVAQPSTAAENRVALVIGIGDYKDPLLGKLAHPKPEADAVAQKLGELGFKVVEAVDRTKQQLLTVLDVFVHDHRGAEAVLVYFTGHGLQIGGQNFLLPTDANFDTTATLQTSAVPLEEIFTRAAKVAPNFLALWGIPGPDPSRQLTRKSGLGSAT